MEKAVLVFEIQCGNWKKWTKSAKTLKNGCQSKMATEICNKKYTFPSSPHVPSCVKVSWRKQFQFLRFGASIEKSGQKKNNNSQKRIPRKSRIFTSVEMKLNNYELYVLFSLQFRPLLSVILREPARMRFVEAFCWISPNPSHGIISAQTPRGLTFPIHHLTTLTWKVIRNIINF